MSKIEKSSRASRESSRREFLKRAAAGCAGLLAAGCAPAAQPTYTPQATGTPRPTYTPHPAPQALPTPAPPGYPDSWDRETDVLVLGSGTVLAAAITAHDAGSEVLVLEKAPFIGGTTGASGGGLWIPNNYLMAEAGIEDSREMAETYLRSFAAGQSTDELIDAYLDNAPLMVEWMRDNAGFEWEPGGWSMEDPEISVFNDYIAEREGGVRRGRQIRPVTPPGAGGGGRLVEYAKQAVDERGIEILLNTPGKRLITDWDGQVLGVWAESNGQPMAIRARKAVILGVGGFAHNAEMVLHFLRVPIYHTCSATSNTGDGHTMGMAIGAQLRNMNEVWGYPGYNVEPEAMAGIEDWSLWRGKPGAIIVNRFGERIGNESAPYDEFYRAFSAYDTDNFAWRNIPSYLVFDTDYIEHYPWPGFYVPGDKPAWIEQGDTLEELAAVLGITEVDSLVATVQAFNENAKMGVDPVWHRGQRHFDIYTNGDRARQDIANPNLAPLEKGPFYGAAVWPGALSTNGGLATNGNAQVKDVWGDVIPRLYASGNTMASVMGAGYPGGGSTIGPGMTFAYLAGMHAAGLEPWA